MWERALEAQGDQDTAMYCNFLLIVNRKRERKARNQADIPTKQGKSLGWLTQEEENQEFERCPGKVGVVGTWAPVNCYKDGLILHSRAKKEPKMQRCDTPLAKSVVFISVRWVFGYKPYQMFRS